MSAAAATTADAGGAKPVKKGKKKLMIMVLAVVVLLLVAGGAAMVLLKKKAAAAEDGDDAAAPAAVEHKSSKIDPKHPPTFVPLDPFVVNLSDKEADRYAQIGITLEVEDEHFGEEMKAFMPAIRNGILLILAHKSSQDLLDREGKDKLAGEIQRDAARTMGFDVEEPDPEDEAADTGKAKAKDGDDDAPKAKSKSKKKKKKAAAEENPIKHVLFSNFIIQ